MKQKHVMKTDLKHKKYPRLSKRVMNICRPTQSPKQTIHITRVTSVGKRSLTLTCDHDGACFHLQTPKNFQRHRSSVPHALISGVCFFESKFIQRSGRRAQDEVEEGERSRRNARLNVTVFTGSAPCETDGRGPRA